MNIKEFSFYSSHLFHGAGRTVKEAKEDAQQYLDAFAKGFKMPQTVSYDGVTALIWCEPGCYCYSLLSPDGQLSRGHCSTSTWDKAYIGAVNHVAQEAYDKSGGYAQGIIAWMEALRVKSSDFAHLVELRLAA